MNHCVYEHEKNCPARISVGPILLFYFTYITALYWYSIVTWIMDALAMHDLSTGR